MIFHSVSVSVFNCELRIFDVYTTHIAFCRYIWEYCLGKEYICKCQSPDTCTYINMFARINLYFLRHVAVLFVRSALMGFFGHHLFWAFNTINKEKKQYLFQVHQIMQFISIVSECGLYLLPHFNSKSGKREKHTTSEQMVSPILAWARAVHSMHERVQKATKKIENKNKNEE